MADMFHLPDLPNAGYATNREKELSDNVMEFLRQIERDRVRLLTIVCEGQEKWTRTIKAVLSYIGCDDEMAAAMFQYLCLLACKPSFQVRLLAAQGNALKWRAVLREAMSDIEAQRETVKLMQKWSPQ